MTLRDLARMILEQPDLDAEVEGELTIGSGDDAWVWVHNAVDIADVAAECEAILVRHGVRRS